MCGWSRLSCDCLSCDFPVASSFASIIRMVHLQTEVLKSKTQSKQETQQHQTEENLTMDVASRLPSC